MAYQIESRLTCETCGSITENYQRYDRRLGWIIGSKTYLSENPCETCSSNEDLEELL